MILIVQFLLILVFTSIIVILLYAMIRGAPYAPLGKQKIETMLSLLNVKVGEKAVDLGSGDGRIVIEMAKKGAIAYGYEINPLLVLIAKWKIKKLGLPKMLIFTGEIFGVKIYRLLMSLLCILLHIVRRQLKQNFVENLNRKLV